MKIEIGKEFWETCGQTSLQGYLYERGAVAPGPVTLVMKQTPYSWRQQHGGPEIYLVPEFMPYCLIESILSLVESGYKIDLEFTTT